MNSPTCFKEMNVKIYNYEPAPDVTAVIMYADDIALCANVNGGYLERRTNWNDGILFLSKQISVFKKDNRKSCIRYFVKIQPQK